MKTLTRPFDIFRPATKDRRARKITTISVDVYLDAEGDEVLTPESLELIDKTQARYMGLLMGEDIRTLRERLCLSQDDLSELLGCGKKSLSRWENGHGYPTQLVNTLLRLLQEGIVTPAQLRCLQEPPVDWMEIIARQKPQSKHFRLKRDAEDVWAGCPALERAQINFQCLVGS